MDHQNVTFFKNMLMYSFKKNYLLSRCLKTDWKEKVNFDNFFFKLRKIR